MPPDGYTTITVPEYLLDRLDEFRDDDGGRRGYAEVIEDLADAVDPDEVDALTVDEFEERMREFADDIATTTSKRTADEIESRLR